MPYNVEAARERLRKKREGISQPTDFVNTSPDYLNSFQSWLDGPINENSWNWVRDAYNRSLQGMTDQMITGKQRYQLDKDYSPNVLQDIGSTALSFMMPLDFLAMVAGGAAARGGLALAGINVKAARAAGKAGMGYIVPQMAQQAGSLAVYEGAIGGVQASIDGDDIWEGITDGAMHGAVLGGIAGGVGGGLGYLNAEVIRGLETAGKLSKGTKEATNILSGTDRAKLMATGMIGQIGAEAGVFTAAEQADHIKNGGDFRFQDALASYAKNIGLFGVLKAKSKVVEKIFAKGNAHLDMLEAAEREKLGIKEDGTSSEGRRFDNIIQEFVKKEQEARDKGEIGQAEAYKELRENYLSDKVGVDPAHKKNVDDYNALRSMYERFKNKGEVSEDTISDFVNLLNSYIGVEEKLIKNATDATSPFYKSALSDFKRTKEELLELSKDIDSPHAKEKPFWTEKKILKEGEKLGVDISDIDLSRVEGRKEATTLLKVERGELVDIGRKKITPLTAEGEAVEILTTKEFSAKDWSRQVPDSKMRKDVESRIKGTDKQKGLADIDAKIIKDTGGFESGSKQSSKYNNSKNIVRHFIQNIFPTQIGKTVRKGALVGNPVQKANRLNAFAKWMAEKKKEFKEVTNEDYQIYLSQKPTHVTELQQLREFLQTNQISSKKFNLTRDMTKTFAKKYIGEAPEGLTFDAHSIGKNSITFVQPKNNVSITKYISTKLKKIFTDLKKSIKTKAPDINQHFITKDGKLINNEVLNSFVDKIFGAKGLRDRARLFRSSLESWAGENFGKSSKEVELIKQEVLGDKASVDVISKAYVKGDYHTQAVKLIKKFIAEINKGGEKKVKGKGFYSTYEIAQGLKNLKGKKDVTFKTNVGTKKKPVYKTITLDAMTAEGIARYLIETSPRLNEVIPSTEAKGTKYQLESAASRLGTSVKELKTQIKYFKEKYPELDIQLKDNLGKFQGEYVLGRVTGHLIDIARGRANADTIPHEVSHHVVDILRAFGDKKSKDLIREGESKFKGEENLVQAIGEYAAGRLRNKSMANKVKNWLQKFWSNIKTKLGIHNESDVVRLLGEKVLEGKLPEGKLAETTTKYQTSKTLKKIMGRIKLQGLEDRAEGIREGVKNKLRKDVFGTTDLTGKLHKYTVAQLLNYEGMLNDVVSGGKRSNVPRLKIPEINDQYHVSTEASKQILKLMGVKDGIYEYASKEQAQEYSSYIRQQYDKPILERVSADEVQALGGKKFSWKQYISRGMMPVWLVLKNYGGKPGKEIAKSLLDHEWVEHVKYRGSGDQAMYTIKKRLGLKKSKYIHLFDKERAKRNYDEGNLTIGEKAFYENVYVKKNAKSDEYKAHQTWNALSEFYWKSLETELSRHQTPEGVRRIMKELDRKKVDGYMTRRLTKKGLEYIEKDKNIIADLVNENIRGGAAKAEAKKRLKVGSEEDIRILEERLKDISTEEGQKFYEDVRTELYDAMVYGYTTVKNPHLIERNSLLKEYVEVVNDKGRLEKIKVYDDSMSATAETYITRMSKYLASVRLFPEWTGVGNKYKIDTSKRKIMEQMENKPDMAGYSIKAIKRQLGIDKTEMQALNMPTYRLLGTLTNTSAALGLSSPMSGIKNLLIGIPRSIGDFGFSNTLSGIRQGFSSLAYHEARRRGELEYGAKTLELGTIGTGRYFNLRNMFKYVNLMTGTENFNRIVSSHAGKLYFAEASSVLRGNKGMFKMGTNKKRMKRLMEELWHLDAEEIKFLENTKDLSSKEAMLKHGEILKKVMHFSHVSAQGGTSTVLLPLWMSSREAKPLTLFLRIATATTVDSHRNFIKPIVEFGNIMPLARAALAHSVSGAVLYAMYDELFGKIKPVGSKELQGDWFSNVMMNLWRSEFFGMFGEALSPHEKDLAVPLATPMVLRNVNQAGKEFRQYMLGGKSLEQAVVDYTKRTAVIYGQFFDAFPKVHSSQYYKDFMQVRSMKHKYLKEKGDARYSEEGKISRRTPYYRNLKYAMMFGSEEDIGKEYWKAFNAIVDMELREDSYMQPWKVAKSVRKSIKSTIKLYDPYNIADSMDGTTKSKQQQFLDWLTPENRRMAKAVKAQYQVRLRKYYRIIADPQWRNKWSAFPNL